MSNYTPHFTDDNTVNLSSDQIAKANYFMDQWAYANNDCERGGKFYEREAARILRSFITPSGAKIVTSNKCRSRNFAQLDVPVADDYLSEW